MPRRAARITHDETVRVIKAARAAGIEIGAIRYTGDLLEIIPKAVDIGTNDGAPLAQGEVIPL